jgi:hypothetical protein
LEHATRRKEFSSRSDRSRNFHETPEKQAFNSIIRAFRDNGTHFAFIRDDATFQAEERQVAVYWKETFEEKNHNESF